MQSQLRQLSQQFQTLKPKFQKLAQDYYKSNYKQDQIAASYINNQVLKAFFTILLNLSYGLFGLGIILTLQSNAISKQDIAEYLEPTGKKIYAVFIILLGAIIFGLLKMIKEESKIQAKNKKILNLIADLLRIAFYLLIIFFVQPFVQAKDNTVLTISFWIFVGAAILFFARKVEKWVYFLFDSKGKHVLEPWASKELTKKENFSKLAEIIQYVFKQSLNKNFVEQIGGDLKKMQKIKAIQDKILTNLEQKNKLMKEVQEFFQ